MPIIRAIKNALVSLVEFADMTMSMSVSVQTDHTMGFNSVLRAPLML